MADKEEGKRNKELKELIKKPYALKKAKSVVMDEVIMYVQGSPDGKFLPMDVQSACKKAGTTYQDVVSWMNDDIELKERFEGSLATVHKLAKLRAERNVMNALEGKLELNDKELVDASFRFLEKTDDRFNPTVKSENKNLSLAASTSIDDLVSQLKSLGLGGDGA